MTRLSRIERAVPARCTTCGCAGTNEDARDSGLLFEYEGTLMSADGMPVTAEDLAACETCGRSRRYCSKVIAGINVLDL